MKRTPLMLAAVGMLCIAWTYDRMDPEDGKILLDEVGGVPEGYQRGKDWDLGVVSYCDWAWWPDVGPYKVQVMFCWAEGPDGWGREYITTASFLDDFNATDDIDKSRASRVGTAETVIGTIEMVGFDIKRDTYGNFKRECIGFTKGWSPRRVFGELLSGKLLSVYVCGRRGLVMHDSKFVEILSGLSIGGEFEALVADHSD